MLPTDTRACCPDRRLSVLLMGLVTLLAYANSFHAVPQFDDYNVIVDNPAVASIGAWWASMPGIRPLLKLSFALNRWAGGLFGFHLSNLLLHFTNVLLGWSLLRRLLGDRHVVAALFAALLFAAHPINVEAISLLSGRSVTLASAFMLGSVLAQLHGRTLCSLLVFIAAMACRETALALAPLLTLVGAWVAGRADKGERNIWRQAWRFSRWHWLLALLGMVLILALPRYRELLLYSLHIRSPLDNLVTQSAALWYLLGQLLRPFAMNADPDLAVFQGWSLYWMFTCAAWVLLMGWSVAAVQRRWWLAFCVLWLVIVMAPGSSVLARLDVANERQLYLAVLPAYGLVGLALQWLVSRRARVGHAIVGLGLSTLVFASLQRNLDYRSETAFWRDVTHKSPHKARGWNNFAYALEREQPQRSAEALAAYERAIELDPNDYKPYFNRLILCRRLAPAEACADFER